ncbi:hypothetical protein NZOSNM25_002041 [Nitrosopumilus zosterae]|nr:hypothetical protein [Nitrosopumilus zosterae]BDQ31899.1 hypothetical protein NZOSNM25_002041 [Nitrosopumilus zosterae]
MKIPNDDGTYSRIVSSSFPTNDVMSISTSKSLGSTNGSILLSVYLIMS